MFAESLRQDLEWPCTRPRESALAKVMTMSWPCSGWPCAGSGRMTLMAGQCPRRPQSRLASWWPRALVCCWPYFAWPWLHTRSELYKTFKNRPSASRPSSEASTFKVCRLGVRLRGKSLWRTKVASMLLHLTLLLAFQCSCTWTSLNCGEGLADRRTGVPWSSRLAERKVEAGGHELESSFAIKLYFNHHTWYQYQCTASLNDAIIQTSNI